MLYVVIGSRAGKTRDEIMEIYPRHKAYLDQFVAQGEVIGVGPLWMQEAEIWLFSAVKARLRLSPNQTRFS